MKTLNIIALTAGTLSIPAAAFALSVGDFAGQDATSVEAMLIANGHTVEEVEVEDGVIEAEFLMNGEMYEIEVDPVTGAIVSLELEDQDEDSDDDDEDDDTDNG